MTTSYFPIINLGIDQKKRSCSRPVFSSPMFWPRRSSDFSRQCPPLQKYTVINNAHQIKGACWHEKYKVHILFLIIQHFTSITKTGGQPIEVPAASLATHRSKHITHYFSGSGHILHLVIAMYPELLHRLESTRKIERDKTPKKDPVGTCIL